jgi:flavin reductase (DIM6/NTAB) family NADH-FMN oxidoreductase RutF
VLAAEQFGLIGRFQRDGAGFDGAEFDLNLQNVPLIAGALARFECEQHATFDGGDHLIVVGRVLRVAMDVGAPLVFANGQMGGFSAEV